MKSDAPTFSLPKDIMRFFYPLDLEVDHFNDEFVEGRNQELDAEGIRRLLSFLKLGKLEKGLYIVLPENLNRKDGFVLDFIDKNTHEIIARADLKERKISTANQTTARAILDAFLALAFEVAEMETLHMEDLRRNCLIILAHSVEQVDDKGSFQVTPVQLRNVAVKNGGSS